MSTEQTGWAEPDGPLTAALAGAGQGEPLYRVAHGPWPPIVCLCGSTRFIGQFNHYRKTLTEAGQIVLSVEVVVPQSRQQDPQHADRELKARLDELHKRKIDLCDYVLVVSDEAGYYGESTRGEIRYAADHRVPVEFVCAAAKRRALDEGLLPVPVGGEA